MKVTNCKIKYQGKDYKIIFVDFKRQIIHIANEGDVKNISFNDVRLSYKVTTEFKDSKSNEVFVRDLVNYKGAEYIVSNYPHLIPKGFDEEKATKKRLSECEVIHYE